MFRTAIASAAFLGTVVLGASIGHAEGGIAIDTDSCGDEDEEWHKALKQAFEDARLVIDAIVPAGIVCPARGPCDNWTSPYIEDNNGASSAYEYWFGDPDEDAWPPGLATSTLSHVKDTLMAVWLALREPISTIEYDGETMPEEVSTVFMCEEHLPEPDHGHGDKDDDYPYRFGESGDGINADDEEIIFFPRFIDSEVPQFSYSGVDDNDNAGFSSRVGVIIHEIIHRRQAGVTDIGQTLQDGVWYGPDACIEVKSDEGAWATIYRTCYWDRECHLLAEEDPGKAVSNNENYEKFTMYVYMHVMAAQFVAATHSLMY